MEWVNWTGPESETINCNFCRQYVVVTEGTVYIVSDSFESANTKCPAPKMYSHVEISLYVYYVYMDV